MVRGADPWGRGGGALQGRRGAAPSAALGLAWDARGLDGPMISFLRPRFGGPSGPWASPVPPPGAAHPPRLGVRAMANSSEYEGRRCGGRRRKDEYEYRAYKIPWYRAHGVSRDEVIKLMHWFRDVVNYVIRYFWSRIWEVDRGRLRANKIELEGGKVIRTPLFPLKPRRPSDDEYNEVRRQLAPRCPWNRHWAYSAVRYAKDIILESWRQRYFRGMARRKMPMLKRLVARAENTLVRSHGNVVRVSIFPWKFIEINTSGMWFLKRVEGWEVAEVEFHEDCIIITFRRPKQRHNVREYIGMDANFDTLDLFSQKHGWVRVDLRPLIHIIQTYDEKRGRIQRLTKKVLKHKVRKLLAKYSKRRNSRVNDYLHKLTTALARLFPDCVIAHEDLSKQGMYGNSRKHNRELRWRPWGRIIALLSYKATTKAVDPRDTSRTCPRCGGRNTERVDGTLVCKRCGLRIDVQLAAAVNIWLRARGIKPSERTWKIIEPATKRRTRLVLDLRSGMLIPAPSP